MTTPDPTSALAERIKELNCLYGISNLFENREVTLESVLSKTADLIPAALQYPDKASVCIRLDGKKYLSANFKKTSRGEKKNTPIMLNGRHVGDLDVFYCETMCSGDNCLFLEEEFLLLQAISERLAKVLWRKLSEDALKESEERYRILTEQVTDGVTLTQDALFCYVNPAFCRIFNIASADDIVNSSVHSPVAGNVDEIILMYEAYGDDGAISAKIEQIHCLSRAGKNLWIQVCHSPITFKSFPAILSTFKDVTEIKEQQIAAESMADQLNDENQVLRASLNDRYRFGNILGRSPVMLEVYELIMKAAATEASVAIFGESGTGKELVAQAIHECSPRKDKNFVAVNCGAIPESLFEREFFGHRKGSFSSAHADSAGYLDMADKGTLFLDEVSELTVNMQAKLLRAIEGGGYRPVGGIEPNQSDFRIISASNVSLSEKVNSGQMRNDFFYRLEIIQIRLPPLRERKQDIALLVDHFVQKMSSTHGLTKIPGHVMDIFMEYDWPGNVRELRNVLQRYLALGRLEFLSPDRAVGATSIEAKLNLPQAVQHLEKTLIAQALKLTNDNRTKAADLLGISRRALSRKTSTL